MKSTKQQADYSPGKMSEHCGICEHFHHEGDNKTGSCDKVYGRIDFTYWCKYFEKVNRRK